MVDQRGWSREFTKDFIKAYENQPCLWCKDHPDYNIKAKREKALSILLTKILKLDPDAIKENVRLKIHCLRLVFFREFTKLKNAKLAGKNFMPSLWYFDLLTFLLSEEQQELVAETKNSLFEYVDKDIISEGDKDDEQIPNDDVLVNGKKIGYPRTWPLAFITEFIQIYKKSPCLWKIKSREHKNRPLRHNAYIVLLKKMKQIEPNATLENVKLKIHSIKSSYYREKNRIRKAEESGSKYIPTLYYYDLLNFLDTTDNGTVRKKSSCFEDEHLESETETETKSPRDENQLEVDPIDLEEDISLKRKNQHKIWPRKFFIEFIKLYKNNPCIWKISCKDYKNRKLKERALQLLLNKVKEMDSAATMETVKLKLNSIRTSFLREVIKQKKARECGDTYTPTLWYYRLVTFLLTKRGGNIPEYLLDGAMGELDTSTEKAMASDLDESQTTNDLILPCEELSESCNIDDNTSYVATSKYWSREFLTDFIQIFKDNECLWKLDSKDRRNHKLKQEAFSALLKKMKEIDPKATMDNVKLKLNSIKSSFFREVSKQRRAKQRGQDHQPVLWYFDMLKFLLYNRKYKQQIRQTNESSNDNQLADEDTRQSLSDDNIDMNEESFLETTTGCSQPWPREFLLDFIELYKSLPCLWETSTATNNQFRNRELKKNALLSLLEKVQEIEPTATLERVKIKLKSLKYRFFSEVSKRNRTKENGSIGTPWYYDHLTFLLKEHNDEELNSTEEELEAEDFYEEEIELQDIQQSEVILIDEEFLTSPRSSSLNNCPTNKNVVDKSVQTRKLPQLAEEYLNNLHIADSFYFCGKYITSKLKNLEQFQNLCAQKLIIDVLLKAESKVLDMNVQIIHNQTKEDLEDMNVLNEDELTLSSDLTETFLHSNSESFDTANISESYKSSASACQSPLRKKRKLQNSCSQTLSLDETFDYFGTLIGNKLRSVTRHQNIFAQKLITDILFEAELETLNESVQVLNCAYIVTGTTG